MRRINRSAAPFLFLVGALVLLGCSHRGPRSAYKTFYQSRFVGVRVPTFEEIASVKNGEGPVILGRSSQQVWAACLGLAAQAKGILGVEHDAGGGHRLLLIYGENLKYKGDRGVFVDRWLAISIRPIAERSTEVYIAFVSPTRAQVAPFYADSFPAGFKGDEQQIVSVRVKERILQALKETAAEDDYLRHIDGGSRRSARGTPRKIDVKEVGRRESVTQQRGNFESARIRRERFVLNVPRLEERIAGVVHDIARAANQLDKEARIFIVSDVLDATHVEPNGDVFITTGALDKTQDVDELAGILSHELAHFYFHHGSMRGGAYKRAGVSRNAAISLSMLGGAVIGGLFPTSKPRSAAPKDTLLSTRDVLVGAGVGLGSMYLAGQIGTAVGVDIGGFTIHRFSRREELEADEYGAELLWAAGYDYRGLLKFLQGQGNGGLFERKKEVRP